jgi:threonine/homoserine/homoserine lactone efflux protein
MWFVAAFAPVALLVTLSPGPDTRVVLSSFRRRGRAAAMATVAGVMSGLLLWAFLSQAETAAGTLIPSKLAALLRVTGLLYQALGGVPKVNRKFAEMQERTQAAAHHGAFVSGLASNLLNPNVCLFYLGVVPMLGSFTGSAAPHQLAMSAVHCVESLAWLGVLAIRGPGKVNAGIAVRVQGCEIN